VAIATRLAVRVTGFTTRLTRSVVRVARPTTRPLLATIRAAGHSIVRVIVVTRLITRVTIAVI
jgi:hypothetical protein